MNNIITIHTIDLNFLGHPHGIAAFLIESDSGLILVESGPHSTSPNLKHEIEKLGFVISDIQHVFLTHIHLDHAGAAWCFAEHGAQIYVHPLGYKHMHDPSRLLHSAKMIYKEAMDILWGTLNPIDEKQLTQVAHNETVSIGNLTMKALHTPGHAKHHIAWRLDDVIFTGDVGGVCINNGPVIPPCPPPDIDIEAWLDSLEILENEKGVSNFYLTHFGRVDNIKEHLSQLRKSLGLYADFAKPFAIKMASVNDTLPEFRKFVQDFLSKYGLSEADLMAYDAANPADMSITGLLRYWNKKWEKEEV